jgi:DNA-binding PadR family transcriptional regulator
MQSFIVTGGRGSRCEHRHSGRKPFSSPCVPCCPLWEDFYIDRIDNINYFVVYVKQPTTLGEFEQVVLLAILRLDKDAYGVTIRSEIATCTGREPAPGALYTTLDRMEDKGIVRSWFGEATPQRGGRAKRYFALTKVGMAALVSAQRAYQTLLDGLDLLGGADA